MVLKVQVPSEKVLGCLGQVVEPSKSAYEDNGLLGPGGH